MQDMFTKRFACGKLDEIPLEISGNMYRIHVRVTPSDGREAGALVHKVPSFSHCTRGTDTLGLLVFLEVAGLAFLRESHGVHSKELLCKGMGSARGQGQSTDLEERINK